MEIKERIYLKVNKLENQKILEFLESWIDAIEQMNFDFSKEEVRGVMEGYAQYRVGDTVTSTEAEKLFEKWLEEK